MIRIELDEKGAGVVGPGIVAEAFQVVAHVPSDVGECGETRYGVTQKAALVFAAGDGVNARIVHVQNDRNNDVAISGKAKHGFKSLPVIKVESGVVESGVQEVVNIFRRPRSEIHGEVVSLHDRFAVVDIGAAGESNTKTVDLEPMEPMEPFDGILHDAIVSPSEQPVSSGAVEE